MTAPRRDDRDRPVVVTSLGRSGSTLMLRLLNLSPDLTVWGEHAAFLVDIMNAVDRIEDANPLVGGRKRRDAVIGELKDPEAFIPWVSPFGPNEFRNQTRAYLRRLFTRPLPDGTRWGFKEIRYRAEHLAGIRGLFPGTQFIFIVRDARGQILSRIQSFKSPDEVVGDDTAVEVGRQIKTAEQQWIERHRGYLPFIEKHRDDCLVVMYDTSRDPVFDAERIFGFIGLDVPPQTALDSVFARRAGTKEAQANQNAWTPEQRDRLKEIVASAELSPEVDELYASLERISRT